MKSLTRYDPFEDLFRGFFVRPLTSEMSTFGAPAMKLDVREDAEAYRVHADMPGVKKEDIHVTVDGNVVTLSAEVKEEKEEREGERLLRQERHYGKMSRSFELAHEVDEAKSSAHFTDGVLELTLPKKAASESRQITIQ